MGEDVKDFTMASTLFEEVLPFIREACKAAVACASYDMVVGDLNIRAYEFKNHFLVDIRRLDDKLLYTRDGFAVSITEHSKFQQVLNEIAARVDIIDIIQQLPDIEQAVLYLMYLEAWDKIEMIVRFRCKGCIKDGEEHDLCNKYRYEKADMAADDAMRLLTLYSVHDKINDLCYNLGFSYEKAVECFQKYNHYNKYDFLKSFIKSLFAPKGPIFDTAREIFLKKLVANHV